jgi:hypothetical protein
MKLILDTSKVSFTVTRGVEPKVDRNNGRQMTDRNTGQELYTVQLMALDENGAEVILVTVAGDVRAVTQGTPVSVVELEAIPWNTERGEKRMAYRARSVTPINAGKPATA